MSEASYIELEPTQMTKAHYSLLKVFVRHHEPEAKKVGRRVAQEYNTPIANKKDEVTLGVSRCMNNRDSASNGDLVPVPYQHIRLHRRNRGRLWCDHKSVENGVVYSRGWN